MLPEIDALPGPEVGSSITNRKGDRALREDRSDVSGHVVGPLGVVLEPGIAVGNEAGDKCSQIVPDFGIRIFAENERSTRVMDEHIAEPELHFARSDDALNLGRKVFEATSAGPNVQ